MLLLSCLTWNVTLVYWLHNSFVSVSFNKGSCLLTSVVQYRQPQGLDPNPLQIPPTFLKPLSLFLPSYSFPSVSWTSLSAHLREVRETSTGRLLLHGAEMGMGRYTAHYIVQGREAGLGVLSGLESICRLWGQHYNGCGLNCVGIFQVIWEDKAFLAAAELCFFKVHQGQKLCSQAAVLSSCTVFSLVLSPASR